MTLSIEAEARIRADVERVTGSVKTTPDRTPAIGGWKTIESAPRDGTLILTWCVHVNAEHCEDAVAEGYAGPVIAKWIDHNGGGFTWHGLAGTHTHWQPLPAPPTTEQTSASEDREALRERDVLRVLDAAGAYLEDQYGASFGLLNPIDRARILKALPTPEGG